MATDSTGLGQAYVDAQKYVLDCITSDKYSPEAVLALAQAFQALTEHGARNANPQRAVSE